MPSMPTCMGSSSTSPSRCRRAAGRSEGLRHRVQDGKAGAAYAVIDLDGDEAPGGAVAARQRQDGEFIGGDAAVREADHVVADHADMPVMDVFVAAPPFDAVAGAIDRKSVV